jgi:hypothetical protein
MGSHAPGGAPLWRAPTQQQPHHTPLSIAALSQPGLGAAASASFLWQPGQDARAEQSDVDWHEIMAEINNDVVGERHAPPAPAQGAPFPRNVPPSLHAIPPWPGQGPAPAPSPAAFPQPAPPFGRGPPPVIAEMGGLTRQQEAGLLAMLQELQRQVGAGAVANAGLLSQLEEAKKRASAAEEAIASLRAAAASTSATAAEARERLAVSEKRAKKATEEKGEAEKRAKAASDTRDAAKEEWVRVAAGLKSAQDEAGTLRAENVKLAAEVKRLGAAFKTAVSERDKAVSGRGNADKLNRQLEAAAEAHASESRVREEEAARLRSTAEGATAQLGAAQAAMSRVTRERDMVRAELAASEESAAAARKAAASAKDAEATARAAMEGWRQKFVYMGQEHTRARELHVRDKSAWSVTFDALQRALRSEPLGSDADIVAFVMGGAGSGVADVRAMLQASAVANREVLAAPAAAPRAVPGVVMAPAAEAPTAETPAADISVTAAAVEVPVPPQAADAAEFASEASSASDDAAEVAASASAQVPEAVKASVEQAPEATSAEQVPAAPASVCNLLQQRAAAFKAATGRVSSTIAETTDVLMGLIRAETIDKQVYFLAQDEAREEAFRQSLSMLHSSKGGAAVAKAAETVNGKPAAAATVGTEETAVEESDLAPLDLPVPLAPSPPPKAVQPLRRASPSPSPTPMDDNDALPPRREVPAPYVAPPAASAPPDDQYDDPLRVPFISIAYLEADDNSCLGRLQSIVKLGCPVDVRRDIKTLLYCIASGKMRCVSFLIDQGVNFGENDSAMRVAALAVRYALESWSNVDSRKAKEEMAWRLAAGVKLVGKGCPLVAPPGADGGPPPRAGGPITDAERQADPVARYDPERLRYGDADLHAPVPVILGVKGHSMDCREAGASGRRFTTFRVAAKAKIVADIWAAWAAAAAAQG